MSATCHVHLLSPLLSSPTCRRACAVDTLLYLKVLEIRCLNSISEGFKRRQILSSDVATQTAVGSCRREHLAVSMRCIDSRKSCDIRIKAFRESRKGRRIQSASATICDDLCWFARAEVTLNYSIRYLIRTYAGRGNPCGH